MKNIRQIIIFSIVFLMLNGLVFFVWQFPIATAQTKPLTYPEIITALNTKLPKAFFKTKADLLRWLTEEIKKRKVDKTLTADREEDLRQAGATDELIEVIRQNSPLPPKPVITPTPKIESTPRPTRTPTPIPTPDNSPPIKMEFVKIPSGSFEMGSNNTERANEQPVHKVKIDSFQMQKTEVTQSQWKEIMKTMTEKCSGRQTRKNFFGNNYPVICVSWEDTQEFIRRMNAKKDGFKYRLPTEAEWEYAARAGAVGEYMEDLQAVAWNQDSNEDTVHNVAKKKPNAWGLYDMLGNVTEWTSDWYDEKYYSQSPNSNPTGAKEGKHKVSRGGSWNQSRNASRYAFRFGADPMERINYHGFRLVREK